MAVINKPHLFDFNNFQDRLETRVGNNRTVEHSATENTRAIFGVLHGHAIFSLIDFGDGTGQIVLDPCGFRTVTTRAAMTDFLKAAGYSAGISFARGEFSAGVNGQCYREDVNSGVIEIPVTF